MSVQELDPYDDFIKSKEKAPEVNLEKEDDETREELEGYVEQLKSSEISLQREALDKIKLKIKTETSSVTSLPSVIRYIYPKIDEIKILLEEWPNDHELRDDLSNLISFISVINPDPLECLRYRVWEKNDLNDWGLEYVRHLILAVRIDYEMKMNDPKYEGIAHENLVDIVSDISRFLFDNHCEIDFMDLHMEVNYHERLENYVSLDNITRMCNYLLVSSRCAGKEDYLDISRFISTQYLSFELMMPAFVAACYTMDVECFHDILLKTVDAYEDYHLTKERALAIQLQMCYLLSRFNMYYGFSDESESETKCDVDKLILIIRNSQLIKAHTDTATELDLMKPIVPDDLFRVVGIKFSSYYSTAYVNNPARMSMATTFVSALANAVFKKDTIFDVEKMDKLVTSHKETALMNVISCLGLLYMWDIDEALLALDKFLESGNRFLKAGAVLAIGIASSNTDEEMSANFAILSDIMYNSVDPLIQRNAIMAIGLAFAGTDSIEIVQALRDVLISNEVDFNNRALAALSLGMVACGTNLSSTFNYYFLEVLPSIESKLKVTDYYARLIPLAIGLLFVGRFEPLPPEIKRLSKYPGAFGQLMLIILKICSNIGSGNLVAIQKLLEYIELTKVPGQPVFYRMNTNSIFSFSVPTDLTSHEKILDFSDTDNEHVLDSNTTGSLLTNPTNEGEEKYDSKHSDLSKTNKSDSKTVSFFSDEQIQPDQHKTLQETIKETASMMDEEPTVREMEQYSEKAENINSSTKKFVSSKDDKDYKRRKEEDLEDDIIQGLATIGVAIISMSDEISMKMSLRLFNAFLQMGNAPVRRAVPVGLGIMYASNPQLNIIEILSKLSHESDSTLSCNAIIALGIVGAGTGNSRIANLLRNLNIFYYRDVDHVFAIRLAQGLLFLGKGLISLSPFRHERAFISPVAISSLLIHALSSLDVKTSYLSLDPFMFFWLVPSMSFRGLVTYDTDGNMVPVPVRVGQPVDDVGQIGQGKRITGFKTHRTPILLNVSERVELASDKFITHINVLEGIVVVEKNPEESN